MSSETAVVIGGGLSGTALAIALATRLPEVRVFERRRPSSEPWRSSANLTLSPRGLACLDALTGLGDAVRARSVPVHGRLVHLSDGLVQQPYGAPSDCLYALKRVDLLEMLRSRADVDGIEWTTAEVQSIDPVTGRLIAIDGGREQQHDFGVVFGADGAGSVVRRALIWCTPVVSSDVVLNEAYQELHLPPSVAEPLPWLEHWNQLHMWPRGESLLVGFPNRDRSFTLLLTMPLIGPGSFRTLTAPDAFAEFWQDRFGDVPLPEGREHAPAATQLRSFELEPWTNERNLAVLGDAAHIFPPYVGQGANLGFEDAAVLVRLLDTEGSWPEVLRAYDRIRPNDVKVVATLARGHRDELTQKLVAPRFLRRKAIEAALVERGGAAYRGIYGGISFTTMPYAEILASSERLDRTTRSIEMMVDDGAAGLETAVEDHLRLDATLRPAPPVDDADADAAGLQRAGLGFMASKVVLAANALGVFALLASGARTCDDVASELELHPRGVPDLLDALVAMGILAKDGSRYRNSAPLADELGRWQPSTQDGFLLLSETRLYDHWSRLTEALRSGRPQNEAAAVPDYYSNLVQDGARLATFTTAMSALSSPSIPGLLACIDWSARTSFVDLGGAEGMVAAQLVLRHPHLRGSLFELPEVEPHFRRLASTLGIDDRIEFVGGDFFVDELPPADVYVVGHVLHNWDVVERRKLVERCHAALPEGGVLVIYESFVQREHPEDVEPFLMSLNMLLVTSHGFCSTVGECADWMRDAGFRSVFSRRLSETTDAVIAVK